MQFLLLIYIDEARIQALPPGELDTLMRGCFDKTDAMRDKGILLGSQQLEPAATARSMRVRDGRTSIVDGPYTETKEMLGGFNIIEAGDMDEAERIASEFPWSRVGCVEIRPVKDLQSVRKKAFA